MPPEQVRVTLLPSLQGSAATPLRQVFTDDNLWERLREEANDVLSREPILASLVLTAVINRHTFEEAVVHRIALRLANNTVSADLIADAFLAALRGVPGIGKGFRADIAAVVDRDPACTRLIEPCSTSRASKRSRRIAWRIGCGTTTSRTLRSICKAAPQTSSRPISIRRRISAAAFSSITRLGSSSGRPPSSKTMSQFFRM
jgi:hypothetical protein